MRKINRALATYPERLNNLTEDNLLHLQNHRNISNSIYAHDDVKNSLQELYFDKCYICENDVSSGSYDIEHYRPKKHFPLLGYTWDNLHKSCDKCNLAKEASEFLIYNTDNKVIDIKLLDPSSVDYDIDHYIRFDIDSLAELVNIGNIPLVKSKAVNTINYLNGKLKSDYGKELPYLRETRAKKFLTFCVDGLVEYRERIRAIKLDIDNYFPPIEPLLLESDIQLCNKLINADHLYLSEKSPFSSCTRVNLFPALKITYIELIKIKEKMRLTLGI